MKIRQRKFLGTILLLTLLFVWAMLGMALAQSPLVSGSALAQFIYYAVVGIGWALPAMPLISWMLRPDKKGAT